jgi:transposase-like protein
LPDVPLNFDWEVAKTGHHWVETHAMDQSSDVRWHFLTRVHGTSGGAFRAVRYQPLAAYSGLFRNFAATDPSLDAIKSFADRYGVLGGNLRKRIVLYGHGRGSHHPMGFGEHVDDWIKEIMVMRLAVDLWEAARQGDSDYLEAMISWAPEHARVSIDTHPDLERGQLPEKPAYVHRAVIADERLDPEILARFVPGDLIAPALHCMQSLVNEHLHHRASPRLLWEPNRDRLGLYIVPDGLIGALWLQFARAVERDARFRQCTECTTWFEVAPGRGRTDKQFCSTACRTRAYRKRQAAAVRLHGEGRSIEDIARELESDPATVRSWIEREGGSGPSPQSETE